MIDKSKYTTAPPTIDDFIHGQNYLSFDRGFLCEKWIDNLKKIFPDAYSSSYDVIVIHGPTATAKSIVSNILVLYDAYRYALLSNPCTDIYNLASGKFYTALVGTSKDKVLQTTLKTINQVKQGIDLFKNPNGKPMLEYAIADHTQYQITLNEYDLFGAYINSAEEISKEHLDYYFNYIVKRVERIDANLRDLNHILVESRDRVTLPACNLRTIEFNTIDIIMDDCLNHCKKGNIAHTVERKFSEKHGIEIDHITITHIEDMSKIYRYALDKYPQFDFKSYVSLKPF